MLAVGKETQFSVLLCTYQRHHLLQDALAALADRTVEAPDEIVVVNGGDSRADEVVSRFCGRHRPNVKLVKTKNVNLATSRNVGFPHCSGDIIALTDDDAQVFPDWVTKMKQAHAQHPEAGAVGGRVLGLNDESLRGRIADLVTFPNWPSARFVRSLPGVNLSYKRSVVEEVGPQDEKLVRGEDVDYNWRILQKGYKILFEPGVKVYHVHRPTIRALLNQFYMYGRSYYQVRLKWPDMYSIYPRRIRSLRDLLRAGHFAVELLYGPFLTASKASDWRTRVAAVPVVMMTGLAWRLGIAREVLHDVKRNRSGS